MERLPHYTRVTDKPDSLNIVTGRSFHYGIRPWRCDDRVSDLISAFCHLDSPAVQYRLFRVLWQCAWSDPGQEPTCDYQRLRRNDVMFYVERYRSGMVRNKVWEVYPYDTHELTRVGEADALRMRVWRHQRQLELEAKEGKIDEVIHASVLSRKK